MQKATHNIYLAIILNLVLFSCSPNTQASIDSEQSNEIKMENNKVRVNMEQQKNKINLKHFHNGEDPASIPKL